MTIEAEPTTKPVEDETEVQPAAEDRGVPPAPGGEEEPRFYLEDAAPPADEGDGDEGDESDEAALVVDPDIRTLIAQQERVISDLRADVARLQPRPGETPAGNQPPKPVEELVTAQD